MFSNSKLIQEGAARRDGSACGEVIDRGGGNTSASCCLGSEADERRIPDYFVGQRRRGVEDGWASFRKC